MSDPNVEVKFTARTDGVEAGAQKAAVAIQESVAQMKAQFESLQSTVKGAMSAISGAMLAVSAVIGGGAIFKEFVSAAMDTTKEAVQLGKALGITATEASYLRSAAAQVGVGMDTLMSAGTRLTRTLLTNEDAVKNLGVATRDAQGHFRNTNDVMQDVNARLREFKEGTDRNVEGMKIYGREWANIAPLVSKFKGVTEDARKEAESLNLVVGEEAVAAMANYKTAQLGVGEVMEGIKNTIGQALLPGLTDLANWFRSVGPQAVEIARGAMQTWLVVVESVKGAVRALWDTLSGFVVAAYNGIMSVFGSGSEPMSAMEFVTNVLKVVQIAFIGLRIGVELACEGIKDSVEYLMEKLKAFAAVAERAFHLDFAGADKAWEEGTAKAEAIVQASVDRMVRIAEKGRADIDKAVLGNPMAAAKVTAIKEKTGGDRSDGKDTKDQRPPSDLSKWDAELKAAKDAYELENGLKKRDLADDLTFWEQKKAIANAANGDLAKVQLKLAETKLAIMKRDVEQGRAVSEEQINEAERASLSQLAILKEEASRKEQLGLITKGQLIAIEQDLEAQKLAIQQSAQQARIAMVEQDPNHSPAALQKEKDKLLEIERKYQEAITQLRTKAAVEDQRYFKQFGDSLTSSFSSVLQTFAQGTMSIKNLFLNMGKAILSSLTQVFSEIAAKWLAKELTMTAATAAGTAERGAFEAAAAAKSVLLWAATAVKNILSSAWEAMAAAYKAIVGIPVIGPELAPVAAGTAFAAVAGFAGSVASARGGYDIPAGVNPLTQLHEKEMVLPAKHADVVRDMAEGGGSKSQPVNIHIHATDAKSVQRLFSENGAALVTALKAQSRNFAF